MEGGGKYVTVSIPRALAEKIDSLIGELGYWPSRGAFVREACLEKVRVEAMRIRELREPGEEAPSKRGDGPSTSRRREGCC